MTAVAHVDDKREAILAAALELFAERGFHGTAVPHIAERAGVGAGTIYRHFASKEAMVNVLYQRWKGMMGASMMGDFPFDQPARVQLAHFGARVFAFARKHPAALKFLEQHHHGTYLDEESRALEARLLEPARHFFEQQLRARVVRKAPVEVLFAIAWGSLMGVIRAHWEGYTPLDAKVEEQTLDAIWDAIRRPD
jgi:AcrR family transcriptional regulator